jgi:hypothetical protein
MGSFTLPQLQYSEAEQITNTQHKTFGLNLARKSLQNDFLKRQFIKKTSKRLLLRHFCSLYGFPVCQG